MGNSLRITLRSLWRKRTFTFLNIIGLAVGIAACLLIFLIIRNEVSFNDYHSKKDRIYRVVAKQFTPAQYADQQRTGIYNGAPISASYSVPGIFSQTIRAEFPELEKVVPCWYLGGEGQIYVPGKGQEEEKRFRAGSFAFSEPTMFETFDYQWLTGNGIELSQPHTAVIDQKTAESYFGNYNKAIGRTIQLWSFRIPFRIIGVFKNQPANSDLLFHIIASFSTFREINPDMFQSSAWQGLSGSSSCFVLVKKGESIDKLEAQLPGFVKKYYQEETRHVSSRTQLHFQPLSDVHLNEQYGTYTGDELSKKELWALGLIGLFLLLVACINFINLSTAQSVNRAKEVGVRKVLGSNRQDLLLQFLGETALVTFCALIIACILAEIALPGLANLLGKFVPMNLLYYPSILLFLGGIFVVVTFLAGAYPGMVLSGFDPVAAIKSKITAKTVGGISLRRGLVVLQFVIAQLLIIGTLVVVKQMDYFRNRPMGFEKKAIATLDLPSDSSLQVKYGYLKTQLLRIPGVQSASFCSEAPIGGGWYRSFRFDGRPDQQDFNLSYRSADTSYLNTFHISMVAGRFLQASDSMRELVLNEMAVRKLGFTHPADIIGKTMSLDESPPLPIVGVVSDFNSKSLRDPIVPLVMAVEPRAFGVLAVRVDPEKMEQTMKAVQAKFTEIYPTYMYSAPWLDESIVGYYRTEAITATLFKIFAGLAIFISCLGLYGLVSFMAVQKTKEVGIRKVLGASVQSIVYLFSKEFTVLIGVAFLVAAPVGYYFMHYWLSGFYYHVGIDWLVFLLAISTSVLVAWLTVGYKAVKAATVSPVKSLKSE